MPCCFYSDKYALGRDERIIGHWYNNQIQGPLVCMQFVGTNEGWRKLRPGSLDEMTKLTMHLAHASTDARRVNYNEVSLNQNEEEYVCSKRNQMTSENRNKGLFHAEGSPNMTSDEKFRKVGS